MSGGYLVGQLLPTMPGVPLSAAHARHTHAARLLRQKVCILLGFLEQMRFLFNSPKCHFYDIFSEMLSSSYLNINFHFSCPLLALLAIGLSTYTAFLMYITHI